MTSDIILFLMQDGLTTGTVYVLLALALVMIFLVTRILFIPHGELVIFAALTLAVLERGTVPATAWLAAGLGIVCAGADILSGRRLGRLRAVLPMALLKALVPAAVLLVLMATAGSPLPQWVRIALTVLIVAPLGPFLYQLVFVPIGRESVLVLMIVAMALHLAMTGLGLAFFGPEGWRTAALVPGTFTLGSLILPGQALVVFAIALAVAVGLYWFFDRTLTGKALRATAINRRGAEIVGIDPVRAGEIAFLMGGVLAALSGIAVSPIMTLYYDSGLLLGLKGFTGAIVGGLAGYLPATIGALFIGVSESAAAFWASSFKEVIVFTLILPVLLLRSLRTQIIEEHEE
ncbi:MAG: branched-chain amino acid ABC transporter permease [Flavobacteriaceae bacterium]